METFSKVRYSPNLSYAMRFVLMSEVLVDMWQLYCGLAPGGGRRARLGGGRSVALLGGRGVAAVRHNLCPMPQRLVPSDLSSLQTHRRDESWSVID